MQNEPHKPTSLVAGGKYTPPPALPLLPLDNFPPANLEKVDLVGALGLIGVGDAGAEVAQLVPPVCGGEEVVHLDVPHAPPMPHGDPSSYPFRGEKKIGLF